MVAVPAGSTLTLRCPGEQPVSLVTMAEVRADFVAELPPMQVLSLDGPGMRRYGILELVSNVGVTWIEAELNDGMLTVSGDTATEVVQRRGAVRKPGTYAATGTVQVDADPGQRLIAVAGQVEDVSTTGLLLRASTAISPHLPPRILRSLLHISMPWGELNATVATVDQRADQLRGTYEWISPADEESLREFCATR